MGEIDEALDHQMNRQAGAGLGARWFGAMAGAWCSPSEVFSVDLFEDDFSHANVFPDPCFGGRICEQESPQRRTRL
jgi:hypothetical protein